MKAMILAAGLGTRMRPLTLTTPKPLIPVRDKPLIEYHLQRLADVGVTDVVINVSWLAEKIQQALGDGSRWGLKIHYSVEPEPLETAGGIRKVLSLLCDTDEQGLETVSDTFIVINGDVFTEMPLAPLLVLSPSHGHIVLVPNPEHNINGDFYVDGVDAKSGELMQAAAGVSDQVLTSSAPQVRYTFSGVSVLNRRLFDEVKPGDIVGLGGLLKAAMKDQSIQASVYSGYWQDVGTIDRLQALEDYLS